MIWLYRSSSSASACSHARDGVIERDLSLPVLALGEAILPAWTTAKRKAGPIPPLNFVRAGRTIGCAR